MRVTQTSSEQVQASLTVYCSFWKIGDKESWDAVRPDELNKTARSLKEAVGIVNRFVQGTVWKRLCSTGSSGVHFIGLKETL